MKFYKLGLVGVLVASAMSQTRLDLRTQTKDVDFSGANSTKPSQTGTILPAACSVGQTFFKTDAAAGQNLYACTAVNVWTVEGGGGGGNLSSVFGRTGTVTAQSGDYSAAQISGLAPSATADTTNAGNITSGTLGAARLPTPGAATLGGVQSKDCSAGGQFLQRVNIDGTETCGTPAGGGNVSGPGTVTNGYLAAWGASNNLLTAGLAVSTVSAANTVAEAGAGGTLAAGWLPSAGSHTVNTTAPLSGGGTVALGGTLTLSCPTCLTANAVPSVFGRIGAVTAQSGDYSAAQISGLAPSATADTTNASNITSGTLGAARLPSAGSHTVNTTAPLSGGGAVALGGTLTLSCPTCLTANAVPSVFGRIGAVTAQSGDYSAAQISGLAPSATTDTTSAANITSGTLGAARLPTPGAATLGGVQSKDCSAGGQFLQKVNTDGTETCGTPAGGGNVSGPGTVTNGYLAAWGASNNLLTAGLAVSSVSAANTVPEAGVGGTLAVGWLPSAGSHTVNTTAPLSGGGAVALGGTLTLACPTCLTANAVPSVFGRTGAVTAQSGDYSAAQISGLAPSATTDTTNAANITSGTLGATRMPTPGAATLGGVQSKDCSAGGQFLQKVNTDGTETCGTPAGGGNVSGPGTVTNGYLATWGASSNLLTAGLAVSTVSAANTVPEAGVGGTLAVGWLPSAGSHTVNTTAPLSGGGAVALGGTLTLACPTCLTTNAVPSVFGRTGAVTAQSGDYSAAQISGLAPSATTDTTSAANITSGTLGAARLPTPGAATLGGVQSKDCSAGGQFLQKVNTDGTETCATPPGGGSTPFTYTSVSFSAAPAFTYGGGTNTFKITLTGPVTSSSVASAAAGQPATFVICQDSAGGHPFAWPAAFHGAMLISATAASLASTCDSQSFNFDGTVYWATSAGVQNQ